MLDNLGNMGWRSGKRSRMTKALKKLKKKLGKELTIIKARKKK